MSPSLPHTARRVVVGLTLAVAVLATIEGCARRLQQSPALHGKPANIAELWQDPVDLEQRDLLHGAGGADRAPRDVSYEFVAKDMTGWSPGFDVRGADGIEWSVKLGPEAQSEVVSSRLLWAIGFHQPPTYYVQRWNLTGQQVGPQEPGRFRPSLPTRRVVGEWSWYDNPFVGSAPYKGLVVANLILTNWDWKTSNNKIYELDAPVSGVNRWYVVRDLGSSLGKFTYPRVLRWFRLRGVGQGTRNDLPGFEQQGFIRAADQRGGVVFEYRGIYRDVVDSVRTGDVRWACALLSRLSERQWNDAFRAAGYSPAQTARYVTKIKAKITEGLALAPASTGLWLHGMDEPADWHGVPVLNALREQESPAVVSLQN